MAMTENQRIDADYIFDKRMTCVVCDKPFTTKILKSNRARRLESDVDLRPRYENIDTLKYGICSCPNCGYSAMHSAFSHFKLPLTPMYITQSARALIKMIIFFIISIPFKN